VPPLQGLIPVSALPALTHPIKPKAGLMGWVSAGLNNFAPAALEIGSRYDLASNKDRVPSLLFGC